MPRASCVDISSSSQLMRRPVSKAFPPVLVGNELPFRYCGSYRHTSENLNSRQRIFKTPTTGSIRQMQSGSVLFIAKHCLLNSRREAVLPTRWHHRSKAAKADSRRSSKHRIAPKMPRWASKQIVLVLMSMPYPR